MARFTDFLVHKSLFTKGFWLAATENTSTMTRKQKKKNVYRTLGRTKQ